MYKVDIKNIVWKPTFDVIVGLHDCALKSFVFGTRIPKSNKIIGFWIKYLTLQFVEKYVLNIEHNCILTFFVLFDILIFPKFHNNVFISTLLCCMSYKSYVNKNVCKMTYDK